MSSLVSPKSILAEAITIARTKLLGWRMLRSGMRGALIQYRPLN